jgi:hypothetical protein
LRAIKALTIRTKALGIFFTGIDTSLRAEISQPTQYITVEGPIPLSSQGYNYFN